MPTWCHMFNSTLTGNARVWLDKLPKESIDSYEDLRAAFRKNYHQQTKHIKDPVEIHHIKKRDGESTKDFMERYKEEVLDVERAPECMKISGFHAMDNSLREVAAFSHGRKKAPTPWKQPEGGNKPSFKKGFKNKHENDKPKAPKKGETAGNERPLAILMVQPGERVAKQKVTQSFSPETTISFPPLGDEDRTEGPMIIEAEIGGHFVHRIQNLDVFAWKPADMTGVPRHTAEHRLNVREGCSPIRQKKRGQVPERNKAIQEEVEKLVDARIMKEVHCHNWLSNLVMVKKHNGSW
ncbi:reverse transcriptase domain-containing protein [Tanacetum coccineum]|uniref:Reverse transcriptase domain-containing protein n=1 Tax=Tanacetum coccineum TaxID=301880 RepID=A0ABQ5F4Q0_9ASTR